MRGRYFAIGAIALASVGTVGCSRTSVEFFVKDGLCYRKRTEIRAGCTTSVSTVLAFQANCHLPPNGQETGSG